MPARPIWFISRSSIAMSGPPKPGETGRGPMTFWGAAMFQWVNVKGWIAVIGTITAYAAIASFPLNIVLQVLIFFAMGVASITTWTLFGTALRPFLTSPATVRVFNLVMAAVAAGLALPGLHGLRVAKTMREEGFTLPLKMFRPRRKLEGARQPIHTET